MHPYNTAVIGRWVQAEDLNVIRFVLTARIIKTVKH